MKTWHALALIALALCVAAWTDSDARADTFAPFYVDLTVSAAPHDKKSAPKTIVCQQTKCRVLPLMNRR